MAFALYSKFIRVKDALRRRNFEELSSGLTELFDFRRDASYRSKWFPTTLRTDAVIRLAYIYSAMRHVRI